MIQDALRAERLDPATERGRRARQARSALLRIPVLIILGVNLWIGEDHASPLVHGYVVAAYAAAAAAALVFASARRGRAWTGMAFGAADAALILALFHEHLLAPATDAGHAMTAVNTAVAFLLLNHSALRLRARFVGIFAGVVLAGWLPLLAAARAWPGLAANREVDLGDEAALAAAFAFAALTLVLLVTDHAAVVRSAVAADRRRASLSRFFSPAVVEDLEARGGTPGLERRDAAVMFVDLRGFSRFSEAVEPVEVARMLSGYRDIVTERVFAWDGTVDKFIGDGVMAVFGHPREAPDDAARALRCAVEVAERLAAWRERRRERGELPLEAGVGVHYGPVVAGVLASADRHEFSVFGDAVNVAERIERLTKTLDASVVVSHALLDRALPISEQAGWVVGREVALTGRGGSIGVAYRPALRAADEAPSPAGRAARAPGGR